MPQGRPMPGERYLHFKNKQYQITAIAVHSETREKMVVYQALYGDFGIYVRPYEMFISEVDHEKYPDVTQKYRFEFQGYAGAETLGQDGQGKPDETASEMIQSKPDETVLEMTQGKPDETVAETERNVQYADVAETEQNAPDAAKAEQGKSDVKAAETDCGGADPVLLEFLDADTYAQKYIILKGIGADITDRLIDDLSASLDIVIPEGDVETRYIQLKNAVSTMCRYETTRFR